MSQINATSPILPVRKIRDDDDDRDDQNILS